MVDVMGKDQIYYSFNGTREYDCCTMGHPVNCIAYGAFLRFLNTHKVFELQVDEPRHQSMSYTGCCLEENTV